MRTYLVLVNMNTGRFHLLIQLTEIVQIYYKQFIGDVCRIFVLFVPKFHAMLKPGSFFLCILFTRILTYSQLKSRMQFFND